MKKVLLMAAATSRTVNDPDNTDNRRFTPFYDDLVDTGFRTAGENVIVITDEAVNIEPGKLDAFMNDPYGLETALRKLDMSQPYGSFSKRREPVPVYERGDTRQLVFGQIVEQRGPVIDTSRVTKRSKRRNRHK